MENKKTWRQQKAASFFEHVEKGNNLLLFSKFCSQCKVRVLAGYVRRERKRNNGTFIAHSLHVFYPFFMYARSLVWTHHYSNTLTYNHAGEKKIKAQNCDFLDEKHFFLLSNLRRKFDAVCHDFLCCLIDFVTFMKHLSIAINLGFSLLNMMLKIKF